MKTTDTDLPLPSHLQSLIELTAERDRSFRLRDYWQFLVFFIGGMLVLSLVDPANVSTFIFAVLSASALYGIAERRSEQRFRRILDVLFAHQNGIHTDATTAAKPVEPSGVVGSPER